MVRRQSGKLVSFPLAMVVIDRQRYLVSMLGGSNWVKNVRAAGGEAWLVHGKREIQPGRGGGPTESANLEEISRAGAGSETAHFDRADAPLEEFEKIAVETPVFRVQVVKKRGETYPQPFPAV